MKKILIFIITIYLFNNYSYAQDYQSFNIELLGHWTTDTLPLNGADASFSSCWGYAADGKEYAILGATTGTYFMDVTDPAKIQYVDFVPSPIRKAIWREYKTYKNYLYMISDDSGPNRLDIVDLSYLPDSVHIAYAGDDLFRAAHTIFIEGDLMYIGIRRGLTEYNNMSVFDLSVDPTKPILIRSLDDDYPDIGAVHDMFVSNDTVYASCGFDGLYIYTFKNNKFEEIGSYRNYPFSGYNHSSILSPDGNTLIFTDEVPFGMPAKSIDVSDISNPFPLDTFTTLSLKATPHNPFLITAYPDKFVLAGYEDGVAVFDYSNPASIKMTGYFDTYYQRDGDESNGENIGVWSVYVNLPSRNLIALDMVNGLYMLDAESAYKSTSSVKRVSSESTSFDVFPNPAFDRLSFTLSEINDQTGIYSIIDQSGFVVKESTFQMSNLSANVKIADLMPGTYLLKLEMGTKSFISKFIKYR